MSYGKQPSGKDSLGPIKADDITDDQLNCITNPNLKKILTSLRDRLLRGGPAGGFSDTVFHEIIVTE